MPRLMRRLAIAPLLLFTACLSSSGGNNGPGAELDGGNPDATFGQDGGEDATAEASRDAGAPDVTVDSSEPVDAGAPPLDSGTGPIDSSVTPDTGAVAEAGGVDSGSPVDAGAPDAFSPPIVLGYDYISATAAIGADGIYFILTDQTALYRAPFGGGPGVALVASAVVASGAANPITTDATSVYWQDASNNHLYSLPLGSSVGATPTPISTSSSVALGVQLVPYQGFLYIAINGGGLERVPIVPPNTPATNTPTAMAGSATCGSLGCDPSLVVTPAGALWTVSYPANQGGGIYGCPLDADAGFLSIGTKVLSVDYVSALATDSTHLYWATAGASGNDGYVAMASTLDVDASVIVASNIGIPDGLAVDTSTNPPSLYWTDRAGTGSIGSAPATPDAAVTTLATGQGIPFGISASAQAVVWTAYNDPDGGVTEIVK